MIIDDTINPSDLKPQLEKFWRLSGAKIQDIEKNYDHQKGSPVFTVKGKYTTRGWTEWTQGFEYGSAVLQYDATGDDQALEFGRRNTVEKMAEHVGHFGVHDHGFNNLSTYGNLLRLMQEGKIPANQWEKDFYELAIKLSGAVQAKRWTQVKDGTGYIYSFNGPHSLFVDTIRTIRILMVSHWLGHSLMDDNDLKVSLLSRAIQHAINTAKFAVYYGEGRDGFDEWGRTAHESIFNTNDGNFRCPNAQQGFSGYTTWTRGLSWAMLGFAEELEALEFLKDADLQEFGGLEKVREIFLKAARATCDFFISHTASDGIPYWDAGAPNLHRLGNYQEKPSDPYNDFEPIDSSAAAIGAQGLLRLGNYLKSQKDKEYLKYWQAGLTSVKTLLSAPYLSEDPGHQGLILHSIYHQPNAWDHVPEGSKVANGESSMWGDYHARELMLYVQRVAEEKKYLTYFGCLDL